ncbi:MAG: ISLre2 family transposase [Acetomicrobium sp.]|nr:ISLre2 family transposase [Acetomicrobium sp.]
MNKDILLQEAINFIKELLEFFGDSEVRTLAEIEDEISRIMKAFIRELIKAYFELADEAILKDKTSRKERGLVVERREDKRSVYTIFGDISFSRTYYFDKSQNAYIYPLDKTLGLDKYERLTEAVAIKLVETAGQVSYAKSSMNVTRGELSKQTVKNKIHSLNLEALKTKVPEKRSINVLHIDADEDHASLQDGRSTNLPLICIYEGTFKEGSKNRCINPIYMSGYGKDTDEFWLEVADKIYELYDPKDIKGIYIHGDGANWIKEGINWLPESKLVLDKFHLNKAILEATARQPEKRRDIYRAINTSDLNFFKQITTEMAKCASSERERKMIADFRRYITNNWGSITIRNEEDCGSSSPEGHVSHVLSSRLSSRPMAWSRKGLKAMSALRAYICSGGKVTSEQVKKKDQEGENADKRHKFTLNLEEILGPVISELGSITVLKTGKVTPLYTTLKGICHGGFDF